MAAEAFIKYYEQFSEEAQFDFTSFRRDRLLLLTPKKMEIPTSSDLKKIVSHMRDGIISNFGQNTFFWQKKFNAKDLQPVYSLLMETKCLISNGDQIAKLILLLHVSKADIEDHSEWLDILTSFDTIAVNDSTVFEFTSQLSELFEHLKTNSIVYSRIENIFKAITGKQEGSKFDLSKLKLHFFSSEMDGVNGFSGFDSIYVSQSELLSMFRKLSDRSIDQIKSFEILKLNFLRLFIHETCHVVLRKHFNDFNLSSPKLTDKGCQFNVAEAGLFGERIFFGNRIDWLKSAKKCNFELCTKFLSDLLKGEDVEFDFSKSGCVINHKKTYNMAIDYNTPNRIFE